MADGTDFPPQTNYDFAELTTPWREYIGRSPGWTQNMAFGGGITRAAFLMDVPWSSFVSGDVISQLLGYSESPAGTGSIRRHIPIPHPCFGYLWCKNIVNVEGVQWQSLNTNVLLDTGPAGILKVPQNVYAGARLTLEFWQPPYAIVPDFIGVPEWARYMEPMVEPSAEYITREASGANFFFNDPASPSAIAGRSIFPGSRNQLLTKKRLAFRWTQIPLMGLFPSLETGNWASTGLDLCVGHINAGSFMGNAPGTLLMEPYGVKFTPWPVSLTKLGIPSSVGVATQVDITLSFLWFDPPVDPAGNGQRGHNLAPDKLSPSGYWYSLAAQGGASQYQSENFEIMFAMQN